MKSNTINIIDRDFGFLGQIDNYESFMLNKKWHGIGGFELHLHEDTTHADKSLKENIIFTSSNKAYVILYREIDSTDGKLIIKGLELKSYLGRWLVFPPAGLAYYRVNSNVETIMKEYVTATLNRKGITNIVVAENNDRGITTVYQSRYKNLGEELEKLSLASGLGWDITLDIENKQFIFDVKEGKDRTVNQDIFPPAIFSIDYDNIAEQRLVESRTNYANTAIVAGQGEGASREISIVGDSEGLDSFELFVDARDIENSVDLPSRGEQKLAEVQEVLSFDSRVFADKNLIYEEDFALGDLTTIQNSKWNITVDRRITEVTEIYEKDGFRLDVAFGDSLPDLIEKIKKATDVPITEGGSQGEPGTPGEDGKSLEFHWNGTQLGARLEGETEYQYVDLKGDKGDRGPQGVQGSKGDTGLQGPQGEIGPIGPTGKSIEYVWSGTKLGIRVEGATSYTYVDLQGPEGTGGDADTLDGKHASDFVQMHVSNLPYVDDFVVFGDSDKYYPVIIHGGNQDLLRTIKIWRRYSENPAPSDWYSSTHKGSLMLYWMGNFGGWGGAAYREIIFENSSQYTTLLADCFRTNHNMAYCFMLRGGGKVGAIYHIASDQSLSNLNIYYSSSDLTYNSSNDRYDVYAPEPRTTINYEKLNSIKLAKISNSGPKIITSSTEPTDIQAGDQWHKEI